MTDTTRGHSGAVYDLLAPLADLPTRYQVFYAKVDVSDDKLRYPYLIVWPAPGDRSILNLTGTLSDLTNTTQITGVGRDADEVLAALDRAGELLQGVKPVIAGRLPGFIRQVPTGAYVTQSDVTRTPEGQPTYRGIAQYSLTSTAAPAS